MRLYVLSESGISPNQSNIDLDGCDVGKPSILRKMSSRGVWMLRAVEVSIGLTKLDPVTVGSGILDPRIILTQNSPWARDGQGQFTYIYHECLSTVGKYSIHMEPVSSWNFGSLLDPWNTLEN